MVLYLIDRNSQWPKFWRVLKYGGIVALLGIAALGGWFKWETAKDQQISQCAELVRARFPGSYDDLGDAALIKKVTAKYPHYCDPK